MRLSIAGTDAHPKHTVGGFIVKQYVEPPLDNPQKQTPVYQGYYLHPKTLGLLSGIRSVDRNKVIETLMNKELPSGIGGRH